MGGRRMSVHGGSGWETRGEVVSGRGVEIEIN